MIWELLQDGICRLDTFLVLFEFVLSLYSSARLF
jgi:hypothetical protein